MYVMESFKIYLPSNACYSIYPNNSSSDYKTRLDVPIALQGEYEVGVESIFYSSNLKLKGNQKAQVYCTVTTAHGNVFEYTADVRPWQFDKIEKAMKHINEKVTNSLRTNLGWKYEESLHNFVLSHNSNGYSKLSLGSELTVRLSNNLYKLLGLCKPTLQYVQPYGVRPISKTIGGERRQLFLLSNIAKPTAYGQERLQILQQFVYKPSKKTVIEKRFEPISYLPLMSNNIEMIQIQITDEDYDPLYLLDYTTIVCLYFRKVRSL